MIVSEYSWHKLVSHENIAPGCYPLKNVKLILIGHLLMKYGDTLFSGRDIDRELRMDKTCYCFPIWMNKANVVCLMNVK